LETYTKKENNFPKSVPRTTGYGSYGPCVFVVHAWRSEINAGILLIRELRSGLKKRIC